MSGGRNEDRWDRVVARWIRSPLVSAFGVTQERRVVLVRAMFQPEGGERPMYWLRLLLSMGIATLGLVLGSTAVIIGAMLISPLMSPIVELGMGIAVGLPRLAVRSFTRVAASAVVVCACAAAITTILPFQEVTPPIAERAAPTVLDLAIAILCALMAAFGTATSTSTAATHAAGTAIGIALVPPVCVVGFGIGAGRFDVAGGAALLFVTNFSAIILFAALTFVAFGFNDFDVDALGPPGRRIAPLWRLVLPGALLAIVFVPLRRALDDVAWEVRARSTVQREVDKVAHETVRSRVRIGRRRIDVELMMIGSPARVGGVERELTQRIREGTGVVPTVSVLALSDADSVARALDRARADIAATPPITPRLQLGEHAAQTLSRTWPRGSAGELAGWRILLERDGAVRVDVAHIGAPLGGPGTELLARALEPPFGARVAVVEHAFTPETIVCPRPIDGGCLARVRAILDDAYAWDGLRVCATRPAAAGDAGLDAGLDSESGSLLLAALVRFGVRAAIDESESWSVSLSMDRCPERPGASPTAFDGGDGGLPDASSAIDAAR